MTLFRNTNDYKNKVSIKPIEDKKIKLFLSEQYGNKTVNS